MPKNEIFKGFFAYAHHDAAASPRLVDTLRVTLELVVNANLVNATKEFSRPPPGPGVPMPVRGRAVRLSAAQVARESQQSATT
jgi:hypothetical protein